MAKDKLKRYAQVQTFPNVTEITDIGMGQRLPDGYWAERFATPTPRITLELACGKGEYTIAQARRHPDRHFIGVDIKGARIWNGAGIALREPLPNVHFLRVWIDHLPLYFPPASLDEIWIVFPDPYLREKQAAKRLTSPKFARIYRSLLRPGAPIHLKTDSPELTASTLEQVRDGWFECPRHIPDIYAHPSSFTGNSPQAPAPPSPGAPSDAAPDDVPEVLTTVQTFYERSHLRKGRTIRYLRLHPGPRTLEP